MNQDNQITDLPISLKFGDECDPLRQPMDPAFIPDEAVANNRNHAHLWLHTDQMHFLQEFDPLKIEQWGPQIEDQMPSTPAMVFVSLGDKLRNSQTSRKKERWDEKKKEEPTDATIGVTRSVVRKF